MSLDLLAKLQHNRFLQNFPAGKMFALFGKSLRLKVRRLARGLSGLVIGIGEADVLSREKKEALLLLLFILLFFFSPSFLSGMPAYLLLRTYEKKRKARGKSSLILLKYFFGACTIYVITKYVRTSQSGHKLVSHFCNLASFVSF